MMRDPKRIRQLIEELAKLWECYPDYRFGQLLNMLLGGNFYTEDDEMLQLIVDARHDVR